MARRDDREYRLYLREEQRRQPGCPARKALLIQLRPATNHATAAGIPMRSSTAFRSAVVNGFSRNGTFRRASSMSTDALSPVMNTKLRARFGSFAINSR